VPRNVAKYDQDSYSNTTVYKETLTGRPHGTSVQKAASDNENEDTVQRHALDITWCGCSLTSCPGRFSNMLA